MIIFIRSEKEKSDMGYFGMGIFRFNVFNNINYQDRLLVKIQECQGLSIYHQYDHAQKVMEVHHISGSFGDSQLIEHN